MTKLKETYEIKGRGMKIGMYHLKTQSLIYCQIKCFLA